jgi:hypothetical protein
MESSQAQSARLLKEKLNTYTWQKRVLLVIAPSANDEQIQKQQDILQKQKAGLQDRDLEIIYLPMNTAKQGDQDFLMRKFNMKPNEFYAILIGKDGTEKLRSAIPLEAEKLFGTIDAMPMRKEEMRNK